MKRLKTTIEDAKKTEYVQPVFQAVPLSINHVPQGQLQHIVLPKRHIPIKPSPDREQSFSKGAMSNNNQESKVLPVVAPSFFSSQRKSTPIERQQDSSSAVVLKKPMQSSKTDEKKVAVSFIGDSLEELPDTQISENKTCLFMRPRTPKPVMKKFLFSETSSQTKLPLIPLHKLTDLGVLDSDKGELNATYPVRPRTALSTRQRIDTLLFAPYPRPISPPLLQQSQQVELFSFRLEDSEDNDSSESSELEL